MRRARRDTQRSATLASFGYAPRPQMKFLQILIAAVAILAGAVAWITSSIHDAKSTVEALCGTTRTGESLAQLEARAQKAGFSLERISAPSTLPEEHRISRSALGRHFGCVFEVRAGRVQKTRFGELPPSRAAL